MPLTVRVESPYMVIVDPHGGQRCNGAHAITVHGLIVMKGKLDVKLSWPATVFLSPQGSEEFYDALAIAVKIARQMEREGEYVESPQRGPRLYHG
jgi:hypothetical protein